MKTFFCTCCKLLGLYLLLGILSYLVMAVAFFRISVEYMSVSGYLGINILGIGVQAIFIYLLLLKSEPLAIWLRVPDEPFPAISVPVAFRTGLLLLGVFLIVQSIDPLFREIIGVMQIFSRQNEFSEGFISREVLRTMLPIIIKFAVAILLLKFPDNIMRYLKITPSTVEENQG